MVVTVHQKGVSFVEEKKVSVRESNLPHFGFCPTVRVVSRKRDFCDGDYVTQSKYFCHDCINTELHSMPRR